MTDLAKFRIRLARPALCSALALIAAQAAHAQQSGGVEGCPLTDGALAADCARLDAGQVYVQSPGANTERDVSGADLGPLGFDITIEEPRRSPDPARPVDSQRDTDLALSAAGVMMTYDGLGVRPRLSVATHDLRSSYVAGSEVRFRTSSNYPAWISRAEVRISEAGGRGRLVATLPVRANGETGWTMPATGDGEYVYLLRVYDATGRYDETRLTELSRSARQHETTEKEHPVIAAGEGEDMTARRSIPIRGGAVTVSGTTFRDSLTVLGEAVPVDGSGRFVVQRILPPGSHRIQVDGQTRTLEIPQSEWFYVGQADLTLGHERNEGSYSLGRIAGYAKGHTASGLTFTFSLDTREGELKNLLRDLDQKNPDRALRRITGSDVYPTFGDDSLTFDDAPTSGKLYAKVEKGASYLMWGDFHAAPGSSPLIRSERMLYGLQGVYQSDETTSHGEARYAFSAYGASPDRLTQRDVLRGTGGSAYFLKRQDILNGTETVYAQTVDPLSGRVTGMQELIAGEDYEIDYFQGVIILRRPLAGTAGSGFLSDRPLGDQDVNLVVQYEYVPAIGEVDGYSAGARAEGWVTENLRFGLSVQSETTGVADNAAAGIDVLYRLGENSFVRLDYAQSEGPGFGSALSLNGGLDMWPSGADPTALPSAGVRGIRAEAWSLSMGADLAELSGGRLDGEISGYYEKKDKGFVSADYDIAEDQIGWGLAGDVRIAPRSRLAFSVESFRRGDDEQQDDGTVTVVHELTPHWSVEAGLSHTNRRDTAVIGGQTGDRTDAGVKLVWKRDDDTSAWIFGQSTVNRSGTMKGNDRYGIGTSLRLGERLTFAGELSDGTLGTAGQAIFGYDNANGSLISFGYRMDPLRRFDRAKDSDGGTFVLGASRRISERLTLRTENTYDLLGNAPSITSTYGVEYSPSDIWTYSGSFDYGRTDAGAAGIYTRKGLSLGLRYVDSDRLEAGVRGEYRLDTSTDGSLNRDSWLISSAVTYRISDSARLLFDVDALISDSEQDALRDGRYVELNFGYAYRPVLHDQLNLLARYTYLEDLPGPDQVNVAGDILGPRQRSHIFSIDMNYDLDTHWTIGAKLGYRSGEIQTRGGGGFVDSSTSLGILRVDYRFERNWDVLAEYRRMLHHESSVIEHGFLAGVYRQLGQNMKLGIGYQWGDVSDDLRLIDGRKEGVFLNLLGKF